MNITQKTDICTGCGMCTAICPSSAIQMQVDSHGFLHPAVDAGKCADCSLCAQKCPISAPPQVSAHTVVLTGYAKDETLLPASSSGAIFPVLAAEIIRRGGVVFGAAFDGDFNVVHTAAETISELSALCSSKYVQSRIPADCYLQVKKALADGRWVYFSGVPCQIAALKSYLGRENATLITQDTACHSVPSPMVWNDYAEALEKQHDGNLTGFSFRNKANGWEGYYICAEFDNSKEFRQPAAENPYQRGFIKGLYSRNSCFSCKFKGIERCSDITLADYWGVKGIQPEAYNPQGTSLILLHSDKGRALLESCQDKLQTATAADDAFAFNPAVLTPIQKPARYNEFWAGYGKTSFYELVSSCCEPTKEELTKERWNKSLLARVIRKLTRCIRR